MQKETVNKSSFNGKVVEYTFAQFLLDSGKLLDMDSENDAKWKMIQGKCSDSLLTSLYTASATFLTFLENKHGKITSFSLCSDQDGAKGESADCVLHTAAASAADFETGATLHLSWKRNKTNKSIKHQRPKALPHQIGMCLNDCVAYNLAYEAISKDFLDRYPSNLYEKFSSVTRVHKTAYLENLTNLAWTYMQKTLDASRNKDAAKATKHFFEFLIGGSVNYLCNFDVKSKTLSIRDFLAHSRQNDDLVSIVWKESFISKRYYITLKFSTGHIFSLRMHTASSRLRNAPTTTCPSVKWDTKLVNLDSLYPVCLVVRN